MFGPLLPYLLLCGDVCFINFFLWKNCLVAVMKSFFGVARLVISSLTYMGWSFTITCEALLLDGFILSQKDWWLEDIQRLLISLLPCLEARLPHVPLTETTTSNFPTIEDVALCLPLT